MPAAIASRLLAKATVEPDKRIAPEFGARHAEKRMGEFGAAGADQADQADDLAGAQGQIRRPRTRLGASGRRFRQRSAQRRRRGR